MALKAKLIDGNGRVLGDADLSEAVFGIRPRDHLMYDMVLSQLASRRQGTAKTKERAEVRGGGRKPYKQKGTGMARQGTIRSPLSPGGGRTFGPQPRSYAYRLPAKMREGALKSALSQAQTNGQVYVVKAFDIEKPQTRAVEALMGQLKISKALFVDTTNEKLDRSVRNLKGVKYLPAAGINVFDILKYGNLLMSAAAVKDIEGRWGR